MRPFITIAILCLSGACMAQTARTYFDELYAAHGLDSRADDYVCFADDQSNPNFFTFLRSDHLTIQQRDLAKTSPQVQAQFRKGFLLVRGYAKGVVLGGEDVYLKDGESWTGEKGKIGHAGFVQVALTINWNTLRYRRTVKEFGPDGTYRTEVAQYGKCENVPRDVPQHGQ
jgi:hypothetical protein